jgi:3-mercaptopyruvate sulfurtransferase SseA
MCKVIDWNFFQNVVLTCGSGVRAGFADTIMQRFGYQHLRIYHGSFDDWREKKGEVVPANFVIDYDN